MRRKDIIIEKYWFIHYPFECLDGWLPLIESMCQEIDILIESRYPSFKTCEEPFEFSQIKEKYGRLVCYPSFANYKIFDIIDKYEEESITVCEICGMKGEIRDLPWVQTLCNKHYSMKLKELNRNEK